MSISLVQRLGDYAVLDLWKRRFYRWLRQGSAVILIFVSGGVVVSGAPLPRPLECVFRVDGNISPQLPFGAASSLFHKITSSPPETNGGDSKDHGEKGRDRAVIFVGEITNTPNINSERGQTFFLLLGGAVCGLLSYAIWKGRGPFHRRK